MFFGQSLQHTAVAGHILIISPLVIVFFWSLPRSIKQDWSELTRTDHECKLTSSTTDYQPLLSPMNLCDLSVLSQTINHFKPLLAKNDHNFSIINHPFTIILPPSNHCNPSLSIILLAGASNRQIQQKYLELVDLALPKEGLASAWAMQQMYQQWGPCLSKPNQATVRQQMMAVWFNQGLYVCTYTDI